MKIRSSLHFPSLAQAIAGSLKAALSLFSAALLLAGGPVTSRGQSALDGFDPNANNLVLAVVVQSDGKIVIGGGFSTVSPNGGAAVARNRLARLNADGTLDATFDPNANSDVNALALQTDGKILVGGFFTTLSPNGGAAVTRNRIARLNADGTLDTTFNPNANNIVRSLAMQTDGKILVGGQFTTLAPNSGAAVTRNRIARLNGDGTLDTAFDPNASSTVFAIALQTDQRILLGGVFTTLTPNGGATVMRNRIARVNPDGMLDTGFDPNASGGVYAIAVQADGKVLAGGDFNGASSIGGQARNRIARLDATTGAADLFNPNANSGVYTIAVQSDGRILVGGDFNGANSIGGAARDNIARLDPATGLADSFDPKASALASIYAIAVQADGKILVGGNFTSLAPDGGAAVARHHIARIDPEGRIVVDSTRDEGDPAPGDGVCGTVLIASGRSGGPCTLRAAIQEANATASANSIQFNIPASDPNCPNGVCTIKLATALQDISQSVNITGPGPSKLTVQRSTANGTPNFRIFNVVTSGTVDFSGLSITTGSALDQGQAGGGVQNVNSGTVNITNCTLSGNHSIGRGGAIYNNGAGIVNVSNSTLSGNSVVGFDATLPTVGYGGAIYNASAGTVTVTSSTLSSNSATGGFGIPSAHKGGQGSGGAIFNLGTVTVTNSTLSGNSARGGACTSPGEGGDGIGGAIGNYATLNITNSTISGNSANGGGGGSSGIGSGGGIYTSTGPASVKSTIIANNTCSGLAPDVSGSFSSQGYNLIGQSDGNAGFTQVTDQKGTSSSALDPKLDPAGLQNNGGPVPTIALLFASPAIDKGTSNGLTGALTTDERGNGFARTFDDPGTPNAAGGDGTDIGAFEVEGTPPTPTPTATPIPATLANISTRLRVGTGNNVLIGGFIVTGTQPKKVIIRAIGPSLPFSGKLANPTLELYQGNTLLESNDNWVDSPNKQAIIDSTIPPSNNLESAIVRTLPANNSQYTAIMRGVNNGTGIGVVEAYDLDRTVDSKLANISTRGLVQTGDNVLIAGTIILGQLPQKVIVRALGPSLPLSGNLANPTLELRDGNAGLIEMNDNWVDSPNKQAIIDSTIPPSNDLESAIVATLPSNGAQYTAIVRGANNATGIAVVEVYALD